MSEPSPAHIACDVIKRRAPDFQPVLGIILGSGLGALADEIENKVTIAYEEIPGFQTCSIVGHEGLLHLGTIHGLPVACLQGRAHYYEGINNEVFLTLIRTLKLMGCKSLVISNAAGSLREDVEPGNVVLISDHINLHQLNPLIGDNDDSFGPRFVGMEDAYDPIFRAHLLSIAKKINMRLTEGVYIATLGPVFETPAEIRAFRILGADVVGMSTIAEVCVARHCGMKTVALSAVTNYAAGMSPEKLSHELTMRGAKLAADKLFRLVFELIKDFSEEKIEI